MNKFIIFCFFIAFHLTTFAQKGGVDIIKGDITSDPLIEFMGHCRLNVTPLPPNSVSCNGGNHVIFVTSNSPISVSVSPPLSATVNYHSNNQYHVITTFPPNITAPYTGSMTVINSCGKSKTISLIQPYCCTLTSDITNIGVPCVGGQIPPAGITITSSCAVSVSNFPSWTNNLAVVLTANNQYALTGTVEANNTNATRTGSITLANCCGVTQTVTITQEGCPPCNYLNTSTPVFSLTCTENTLGIFVISDCIPVATSDANWMTHVLTSDPEIIASGELGRALTFNVEPNTTGVERIAHVTFTVNGFSKTVTITQEGCPPCNYLNTSTPVFSLTCTENTLGIFVISDCIPVATSNANWMTHVLTSDPEIIASGELGRALTFNVEPNTTGVERIAHVTFTVNGFSKTVTITQEGCPPSCTDIYEPNGLAGQCSSNYNIGVTSSNTNWSWSGSATIDGNDHDIFSVTVDNTLYYISVVAWLENGQAARCYNLEVSIQQGVDGGSFLCAQTSSLNGSMLNTTIVIANQFCTNLTDDDGIAGWSNLCYSLPSSCTDIYEPNNSLSTSYDMGSVICELDCTDEQVIWTGTASITGDDEDYFNITIGSNIYYIKVIVWEWDGPNPNPCYALTVTATGGINPGVISLCATTSSVNNSSVNADVVIIDSNYQYLNHDANDYGWSTVCWTVNCNEIEAEKTNSNVNENISLSISPMPAVSYINLQYLDSQNLKSQLNIFDISGKIVAQYQVIPNTPNEINIAQLPQGIYIAGIQMPDGTLKTTKFVKQ